MSEESSQRSGLSSAPSGDARASSNIRWAFGTFIVWEGQRRIESSGKAVRLGSRCFDLLLQLLKRAGEPISKDELLSVVWRGVIVEEAGVRVQMSQLRKALGEPGNTDDCNEWISTIPRLGYCFNGTVRCMGIDAPDPDHVLIASPLARLPLRLTGLVGRDLDIENILDALGNRRLVTLFGPGGIGKTSTAIRVAERIEQETAAEIAFVDLAPLISPEHVLGTIARSSGVAADLPDPVEVIIQNFAARKVLLLIDNCEQVLDALAEPLTRLLTRLPELRILATSREALRLAGEYVYRLPALTVPDAEHFTLAQAMRWPAVELLVARARAAGASEFNESDGPLLAKISRQLDGMPLAIELVAARLGVQSISDLALRLDDHMRLLSIDNRGAFARHQSLAAALDWSIELLNEDELRAFRRLSVFRGRFDLEYALGVTGHGTPRDEAFVALISLVSKSLVVFDSNDPIAPYRLLDTTRSYASRLLERSGERLAVFRHYAMHTLERMHVAADNLPKLSEPAWGERYAHHLNDVRFALDACLTVPTAAQIGASLVSASAPLWFHVSQVAEYGERVVAALAQVDQLSEPDVELVARLNAELMVVLLHTRGPNSDLEVACQRALAGAIAIESRSLELKARWGQSTHDMFRGEYATALKHAETLFAVARSWSDPAVINLSHRACAMASYFCGQFDVSAEHCRMSLNLSAGVKHTGPDLVGVNTIVAAKALLSRTLWIQGQTAEALRAAGDAVDIARSGGHIVSLLVALYCACPVALWSGDLELAEKWVRMMREEATHRGQSVWLRYADWYAQGFKSFADGDPEARERDIAGQRLMPEMPGRELLVTFCVDWIDDELVARVDRGEAPWCAAEVWRAAGWRSQCRGMLEEAERLYLQSLETARQQGARGWERRTASSLAGLWRVTRRPEQALNLLDEILAGIVPGSKDHAIVAMVELRQKIAQELSWS